MPENKIKYGLKNVHYSVITVTGGVPSYATPVAIPGAVNLSLPAVGEKTEFYADDSAYFKAWANDGYEGTLEIALIPDAFKTDVMGEIIDNNGAYIENADVIAKDFALMFEFNGDVKATRHVLYNCNTSRPNVEGQTKEKKIDPKTESLNIKASPAVDTKNVKAKLPYGATGYDTFFSAVYLEDAPTNAVAAGVEYTKSSGTDLVVTYTTTATAHSIKDVRIDGASIGGANVTIDTTGKTVTISDTYLDTKAAGNYTLSLVFNVGNAVDVDLEIKAAA